MNRAIAAGILKDRTQRRKALGTCAFLLLGMFALGLWGIDGWLERGWVRFAIYWGACGLWCLWVMVFALFDALSVLKEERERGGDG